MIRGGYALLLAMLMSAALSMVGLGVMAIGIREAGIARFAGDRARARAAAEAAVLETAANWSTRANASLAIGAMREIESPAADIRVTRIDTALFAIEAEGSGSDPRDPSRATARAALLVRILDAGRVVRDFPAALSATGSVRLEGGAVWTHDACGPATAVMAPTVDLGAAQLVGAIVEASPPGSGPLPIEHLEPHARVGPGVIRPDPRTRAGECYVVPRNWGALDPDHPCHDLVPVIAASGPLVVSGGSGRGILVVQGDLALRDGFRFQGLVLVRGRLWIGEGVAIEGAVRADSVVLMDGEVLTGSCGLTRLLAEALDGAFRPPSRWWIPVY